MAGYGWEHTGWKNTVGLGEEPRGQEKTWMGLSAASALLDDLALVVLGGLQVLAFHSHWLRPEEARGVP